MKEFRHSGILLAFLALGCASLLMAQSSLRGGDYEWFDDYDDHHHHSSGDSSSMSVIPVSQAADHNAALGSVDRAEAAIWNHLATPAPARQSDLGMWLTPFYEHSSSHDLGADGVTTRRNSGGSGFGMDFDIGNFLVGGAIDTGYRKVTTKSAFATTKNESEFFGFMGYVDWKSGALRLYGAQGISTDFHELKLDMGGARQRKDFVTVSLSGAGFAEYTFSSFVDVAPYAGVRYAFIDTERYRLGGVTYSAKDQLIVRFPVGLKVTRDFNFGGFYLRPGVNCYVEPVCGDTDSKTKIHSRSMGINQTDEARMTDDFYWHATAGVTVGFEAFILSLNYGYHGSSHEKRHGFSISYNMVF